jgi:transcriptional regulator with XRE-family HTH domain
MTKPAKGEKNRKCMAENSSAAGKVCRMTFPRGTADADEHARRARVARCWAGFSRDELAHKMGVSFHTVERTETGRRAVTPDELARIGYLCGVPESFMRYGWASCAPSKRLDELYARLEQLAQQRVAELRRELEQNALETRSPTNASN